MDILEEPEEGVQPEPFRQSVDPPAPEPAPEPVAPADPAPEPSAEPQVVPDWLNEPVAPAAPDPAPQYPPQPPPQYPPHVPQQAPPQNLPRGVEGLVQDTDRYIEQIVEERLSRIVPQIAHGQQQIAAQTQMLKDSQVVAGEQAVDSAIVNAYKEFNKDPSFRASKELQGEIKNTLEGLKNQALAEAYQFGDFRRLNNMASISEREIQATLAVGKIKAGLQGKASGPLEVAGAVVESATPTVPDKEVVLTAEQEAIAARVGGNYADRLRQAIKENEKHDDFEG